MMRNIRYIFGWVVLVALLSACSKDADLYTPQHQVEQKERPSAMPIEPGNNGGKDSGTTTGNPGSNSTSPKPPITSSTDPGNNNGNISISDDDDDEDDDN